MVFVRTFKHFTCSISVGSNIQAGFAPVMLTYAIASLNSFSSRLTVRGKPTPPVAHSSRGLMAAKTYSARSSGGRVRDLAAKIYIQTVADKPTSGPL